MKPPEEIAREIANGAVKFDWNTGSAGFHTRRAMIQTYIFNVPVRLIPGENEDVVVAKFEKWAEPIRGRIATTLAVLVRAAISAERSAGTVPPAPAPGDLIARYTLEEWRSMEARSRELPDEPEDEEVEVCPPKPAPACARCGGSGEIRLYLPDEPDYHVKDPCPECRGKP